ncbi:MAG: relaxase/mobilization nuclease domain-containing protein [Lachnospiraceae bacterium]|nr:relaxase/mobilization nuclease domain-containing protein [Lachnospiraceae bacterium]
MAYTKIHAIKASISSAVAYICNPKKTDEKLLIDSFGCSPETAALDFKFALSKGRSSDNNKGFHLIQSFMPGEVSYDEAHQIGIELADRLLQTKYSYVVATHIDHNHIHNHIVFCATDNIEHKKYDDNRRSYYHIRELSDQLCQEHNLSVIIPGPKRGLKYNEWLAQKNGTSWKEKLRNDIDECIKISNSYDHFVELIKAKGYEVKGQDFGEGSAKYIAFRPLEGKQFVRGSARSLGPEYSKEEIKNRIDNNIEKSKQKIPFPKKQPVNLDETKTVDDMLKRQPKDPLKGPRTTLIDTSIDKFQQSPGLLQWANVQNLKAMASAYASANSIAELEVKIAEQKTLVKTSKESLVALEKKMKPAADILHYAEIYQTNLRYHNAMAKSKDPDRYYRNHDTEINLFNAAEHALKSIYGINPDKMNYKKMSEQFQLMLDKKATLSETWKSAEKELSSLEKQLQELQSYLELQQLPTQEEVKEEPEKQTPEETKSKDKKTTLQ